MFVDPSGKIPYTKVVENSVVTSKFGERTHPITGVKKMHTGVDLGTYGTVGHDVHVLADGVVIKVDVQRSRENPKGYGQYIIVQHAGGYESRYAHLELDGVSVQVGDYVYENDVIAKSGNTGASTGPHLHLEISKGDITNRENRIDPASITDLQHLVSPDNNNYDGGVLNEVIIQEKFTPKQHLVPVEIDEYIFEIDIENRL